MRSRLPDPAQSKENVVAYASINGIEFYYEVHGQGAPVVFAHGAGGNHAIWYQQVPFFSRYFQVITIDHRGFGHSDDLNNLGRSSFVDDLRALLDSLGIEKAGLVAQSMGGARRWASPCKYPERTRALVMADTLGGVMLPEPLGSSTAHQHRGHARPATARARDVAQPADARPGEGAALPAGRELQQGQRLPFRHARPAR